MASTFKRDHQIRIERRQAKIAACMVRGITNIDEIVHRLGMDEIKAARGTVCQDMQAIRQAWRDSIFRNFNEDKNRQLAKLEAAEKELWEAWERSKQPADTEDESIDRKKNSHGNLVISTRKETSKRTYRDGNPAFFQRLVEVWDRQNELLGLIVKKDGDLSTMPPLIGFEFIVPTAVNPPTPALTVVNDSVDDGLPEPMENVPDDTPGGTDSEPPA